jgi:hypothetical protein
MAVQLKLKVFYPHILVLHLIMKVLEVNYLFYLPHKILHKPTIYL